MIFHWEHLVQVTSIMNLIEIHYIDSELKYVKR
jgi:hypothetical protein